MDPCRLLVKHITLPYHMLNGVTNVPDHAFDDNADFSPGYVVFADGVHDLVGFGAG